MSCKEIVQDAQLNTSTSKQRYSFGHDIRFKEKSYKALNDQIYNIPTKNDKRATSFGRGDKFDFFKVASKNPAPDQYEHKTQFDLKKGQTMGVSRGNVKFNSILNNLDKNPGPGKYNHDSQLSNIRYTMRQRTKNEDFTIQKEPVPGPGAYNSIAGINKEGRFNVSKFKSYGVAIINPAKSVSSTGKLNPGPGHYELKNQIGQAVSSQYRDHKGLAFPNVGRSNNKSHSYLNVPGPGTYRQKSDFGYYEKNILEERRVNASQSELKE